MKVSSDSAASTTENTSKRRRRSRKSRGSHEEGGLSNAHEAVEPAPAPANASPKPPVDSAPPPASSSADHVPTDLPPQQAPVMDVGEEAPATQPAPPEPPTQHPTRAELPEMPAQKDAAVVPPTEQRKPDDVFLVSAVACAVMIAGLALAVAGIVLGMSMPPTEHSCPMPDKPLAEGNVMLETKEGRLVGSTVVLEGVTLARFLGIPFAQSTAGDRRFAAPLPLPSTGDKCVVKEYLEPGPPCAQWNNGNVLGSEDCLHMNVWTPAAAIGDSHGGGRALVVAVSGKWFESGSNNDPNWPMLAAKGESTGAAEDLAGLLDDKGARYCSRLNTLRGSFHARRLRETRDTDDHTSCWLCREDEPAPRRVVSRRMSSSQHESALPWKMGPADETKIGVVCDTQ
ncbi:hypothetical protein HPB51_020794 [Rhipicephalus microplus]|uniref:Carboxylesterase type B domain-containing protein n=1 Tax=Rhipicephalus microplus TaxID=6941 RepID=A0A9J6DPS2_RHIMP|nr:hypothetical protein HPB51_020794 [Rhipicephalus microplus]